MAFHFLNLPRQNRASAVPTTRSKLGKKSQKCLLCTAAKPCYVSNLEFHQSFEQCFALRGLFTLRIQLKDSKKSLSERLSLGLVLTARIF